MQICKTEKEFIDQVMPAAVKLCRKYGFLPSCIGGMAALENGYGIPEYWDNPEIEKLMLKNNILGMKSDLLNSSWSEQTVWKGESFYKTTPEVIDGERIKKLDAFRAYDSIEQCIEDFLLFLTYASNEGPGGRPKYGREVLGIKSPRKLMGAMVERKYATDPEYAENVLAIIIRHDLGMIYDKQLERGEEQKMSTLNINRDWITTNNTNAYNDPRNIVIHNTDNERQGADAYAHAEGLYNGDMDRMSWHYVVDDKSIYQCVEHKRGAWHVGRNYGTDNLFGIVNNSNSICIEICVNKGYNYESAFQNAVALTRQLMQELQIRPDHVYQHYDICSKNCPSAIRAHGDWARFKALISEGQGEIGEEKNYGATFQMVHRGSRGVDVGTLQKLLRAMDYKGSDEKALTLDNEFGANTEHAVRSYQETAGLNPDGWCGPLTWASLLGK